MYLLATRANYYLNTNKNNNYYYHYNSKTKNLVKTLLHLLANQIVMQLELLI